MIYLLIVNKKATDNIIAIIDTMNDRVFIESSRPPRRARQYSQTLTGLGKWWGRKPLVLVRAAIIDILMPVSGDAQKYPEIFLEIMTMRDESQRGTET